MKLLIFFFLWRMWIILTTILNLNELIRIEPKHNWVWVKMPVWVVCATGLTVDPYTWTPPGIDVDFHFSCLNQTNHCKIAREAASLLVSGPAPPHSPPSDQFQFYPFFHRLLILTFGTLLFLNLIIMLYHSAQSDLIVFLICH